MAKEAENSGQSNGKQKSGRTGSTGSKPGASASSKTGAGEIGSQAKRQSQVAGSGQSGAEKAKSTIGEFQSRRHEELQGILDKRSEESANAPEIVREFVTVWLPHHLAEAEVLVPAFEEAGVDEDKMAAVRIRKDILNILLADLLASGAAEHAEPKLEALADAWEAVVKAASQELESLAQADGTDLSDLREQLDACFEEAKAEFEDEENFREAMVLLAPRALSVVPMRRQDRREGRPRRSEDERLGAGRGSSDRERGFRGRRDEDEGYRSRRTGRDDDERYGRREDRRSGQSGWPGDREDRWQAAGREWLGSEYRSSRRDDDEGYARARDADEDRRLSPRRGGDYSGGYESRPGGRESGRQARGYGGYEGPREGGRYEEDERRFRGRGGGRFPDEDDRGSRGRMSGGWAGDPEGHSEAARKGWEHRR